MQRFNTRIHTVIWYICKMSISNQSSLVSTIMLDIIDEMDSDGLVPRRWFCFEPLILKDLVSFHRCKFKLGSILPFSVAIALINLNCMSKVSWYLISIFVLGSSAKFPNFGKVGKPKEVLLFLCKSSEPSPVREVKEGIVTGIHGTRYRIISGYDRERFIRSLSILPQHSHIVW